MKLSQFILTFFVVAILKSTCIIGFERKLEADVEIPGTDRAAVHPPNGLRRTQAISGTGSDGFVPTTDTSASDASSIAETEAPTTIMVLLPDNLAPSYSGSGSVMFFNRGVGDEDKDNSKSAGSDTVNDEASNAASVGTATAVTAFTVLFAFVLA